MQGFLGCLGKLIKPSSNNQSLTPFLSLMLISAPSLTSPFIVCSFPSFAAVCIGVCLEKEKTVVSVIISDTSQIIFMFYLLKNTFPVAWCSEHCSQLIYKVVVNGTALPQLSFSLSSKIYFYCHSDKCGVVFRQTRCFSFTESQSCYWTKLSSLLPLKSQT